MKTINSYLFCYFSISRITELATKEAKYFTANMEKMYPVKHRMALPGAKPPKAPPQRQSLNIPTIVTSIRNPSPSSRHSQPPISTKSTDNLNQGLFRSGRDPIRRKKPVPMPRTFTESAIDVPQDFEIAAYSKPSESGTRHVRQSLGKQNNIQHANAGYRSSPTRPKSMIEGMNSKDTYRVSQSINIYTVILVIIIERKEGRDNI